jgi:hypothetical protein
MTLFTTRDACINNSIVYSKSLSIYPNRKDKLWNIDWDILTTYAGAADMLKITTDLGSQ